MNLMQEQGTNFFDGLNKGAVVVNKEFIILSGNDKKIT
jgi:hypothetical protein